MFGPVNPGVTYPHWSDYSNVTLANLYKYVKRMSGKKGL